MLRKSMEFLKDLLFEPNLGRVFHLISSYLISVKLTSRFAINCHNKLHRAAALSHRGRSWL